MTIFYCFRRKVLKKANNLVPGFVKADSTNLPKIDIFMVCEFIKKSDKFNPAEVKNEKAAM